MKQVIGTDKYHEKHKKNKAGIHPVKTIDYREPAKSERSLQSLIHRCHKDIFN